MKIMKYLAIAAALTITSGVANATTVGPCGNPSVSFSLTQDSPDAVQNSGCFSGNDKGGPGSVPGETFFGSDKWVLGFATDDGDGSGNVTIALTGQNWSLSGMTFQHMMVALKQANSFALFKLDSTKALSGTWGTQQFNPMGMLTSTNDLSHASIWYVPDSIAPIPLPAAGWLMLAGLGGLAALRRRKSADKAA